MKASPRPSILIVDDTPDNLQLFFRILNARGYNARPVSSGSLALDAARQLPPDLILLDINMPEMDGYEVCKRLKADPELKEIPVVFISAMNETFNKVKAFGAGGVDYVTKPFQAEEVEARLKTHLELSRVKRELLTHNLKLEEQVRQRTQELAEANSRLSILDKTKSDFLTVISHELRTPLNGLFGIVELMFDECPSNPLMTQMRGHFDSCRERLLTMVKDALLLTEIGAESHTFAHTLSPFDLALYGALAKANAFAQSRKVDFGDPPVFSASVFAETDLLIKALEALLETAVRFSDPGGSVLLMGSVSPSRTHLLIEATGHNIPPDALPRFFDVLAIAESITPGGDLGLRLPVAERIIRLFGGTVTVENLEPPGIRLSVCMKRPREAKGLPQSQG